MATKIQLLWSPAKMNFRVCFQGFWHDICVFCFLWVCQFSFIGIQVIVKSPLHDVQSFPAFFLEISHYCPDKLSWRWRLGDWVYVAQRVRFDLVKWQQTDQACLFFRHTMLEGQLHPEELGKAEKVEIGLIRKAAWGLQLQQMSRRTIARCQLL